MEVLLYMAMLCVHVQQLLCKQQYRYQRDGRYVASLHTLNICIQFIMQQLQLLTCSPTRVQPYERTRLPSLRILVCGITNCKQQLDLATLRSRMMQPRSYVVNILMAHGHATSYVHARLRNIRSYFYCPSYCILLQLKL